MKSPLALGIDTSTAWGSLGLVEGSDFLASSTLRSQRGKGHGLLSRIEGLLSDCGKQPSDLGVIGVVNGPGSFTSLRIGVTVAQGLGFGLGIPVVPCNTLAAVALGIPPLERELVVLIPARNGEVFAQAFNFAEENDSWNPRGVIHCLPVEELLSISPGQPFVAGPAINFYEEEISALFGGNALLAPPTLRYSRGEALAYWALGKALLAGESYSSETIGIHYLQSHGALTIEEREERKR